MKFLKTSVIQTHLTQRDTTKSLRHYVSVEHKKPKDTNKVGHNKPGWTIKG